MIPPRNTHDLQLPDWGPYTKRYMGLSHIADGERGWRFDLAVAPGFYRRKLDIPNVLWESGYHPWEASPGLEYFSHRHELEWKDRVYCDVAFAGGAGGAGGMGNARLIRCQCVNRTEEPQNIVLHWMASLQFPKARPAEPALPVGAAWLDALDYERMEFAAPRPSDLLVPDLLLRGEVRGEGFTKGSGLAIGSGAGGRARYRFLLREPVAEAVLLIRYRRAGAGVARLRLEGMIEITLELAAGGGFGDCAAPLGSLAAGEHLLDVTALAGTEIVLDGFVIVTERDAGKVAYAPERRESEPGLIAGPVAGSILLKYPGLGHHYGIAWDFESYRVREYLCAELDIFMRERVHDHVPNRFTGPGEGDFTDIYLHPIALPAHTERVLEGMVCAGSAEEVTKMLADFPRNKEWRASVIETAKSKVPSPPAKAAGAEDEFSQARMRATLLTNVVYPAYARRAHIRHNTPGRQWDSLYTWDSGFLGLGLAEIDLQRAVDCLNAYLTEPGDAHAAFAHHGTPLPVQHYLYLELWNRTRSVELLDHFYPPLRQYYAFLAGRDARSSTRRRSNLLSTWDYFYNSGGWDDYPPQKHIHAQGLAGATTPAVTTAHCIRIAKILRMAALALGRKEDIAAYDEDIATLAEALQRWAWDEDSGYFGYVRHDAEGGADGILRHESGANFNMGMDGVSPLVAGICPPRQEARLLAHLRSPRELWTESGLSTVDRSAPYYRNDGYWNGAVWMPHQWFIWKTMLDLGEAGFAFQIADTALRLWRREVGATYNCFEHFSIETGRGAGWHHFGGLSAPVLSWFAAYYQPGRLTGGFDAWLRELEFPAPYESLRAHLSLHGAARGSTSVIAVMAEGHPYRASWAGREIPVHEWIPGTLGLELDPAVSEGWLEVSRR